MQVFSPLPRIPRKQRNTANDMLSIRDEFQEKMLRRVKKELGKFSKGENWKLSERGRTGRSVEEGSRL